MTEPRKTTKTEMCKQHAPRFAGSTRRRIAETFVEGGPGGGPCSDDGPCKLWPGTDFYSETYCHSELELDWTTARARIVSVSYMVPVMVTVDLDEKTVTRVRIIGEAIDQNREGYAENAETFHAVTDAELARAYDVAENAEWPGWEAN